MKWKKFAYALTGAVFTLIISYSWISWADNQSTADSTSNEEKTNLAPTGDVKGSGDISYLNQENMKIAIFDGKQKKTYQLSDQTQVIINEKPSTLQQVELGAHAEVMLNSAGDVRYLLVEQKAVQNTPVPITNNVTQPSTTGKQTIASSTPSFPWDKWKMDLHQGNIKVKLEWDEDKAEVEWKTPQKEVRLKGDQAKSFILAWYANSGLSQQNDKEKLVYQILKSFSIQTGKPFTCNIEWKQKDGKEGKWTVHPKDHGKEKGKEKHKDDDHDEDED